MVRGRPAGRDGWRMTTNRPGFLIVGAQKCGSTMLHHVLSSHPQLYLPPSKELHYFDRSSGYPDAAWYQAQFAPAGTQLTGEATPIYCFWPGAIERIAADLPQVKVILILRDPVERAISQHRMELARGDEDLPLLAALQAEKNRLAHGGEHALRHHSYVARGRYRTQVAALHKAFGMERVLLMSLERLVAGTGPGLNELARFLGVDAAPLPTEVPKVFAGEALGQPVDPVARRFLENALGDERKALDEWFAGGFST